MLLAAGGHHGLELVVGLLEPGRCLLVPALGDVLGVGVRVGGEGAGEHLEAGDEAVAVRHVLEQRAEAVDEGLLVLAVAQADARALDLDRGGDGAAVGVQEYGDLVGAEGAASQEIRPMPGGGPISTSLPSRRVPASWTLLRYAVPLRRLRL